MREIKFRAWDEENKEMKYFNLSEYMCSNEGTQDEMVKPYNDIIETLMQYTGLKDKNGKEIYEGDIIRDGFNEIERISWNENGLWQVGKVWICHTNTNELEVIGNIYENPELLENK